MPNADQYESKQLNCSEVQIIPDYKDLRHSIRTVIVDCEISLVLPRIVGCRVDVNIRVVINFQCKKLPSSYQSLSFSDNVSESDSVSPQHFHSFQGVPKKSAINNSHSSLRDDCQHKNEELKIRGFSTRNIGYSKLQNPMTRLKNNQCKTHIFFISKYNIKSLIVSLLVHSTKKIKIK